MNKTFLKIGLFVLFFIIIIFLINLAKNKALRQNFSGIIKKVSIYGGKSDIKVTLDSNEEFLLDLYSVKPESNVEIDDSLFKEKGRLELYHYKKDSLDHFYLYNIHRYTSFFDWK